MLRKGTGFKQEANDQIKCRQKFSPSMLIPKPELEYN